MPEIVDVKPEVEQNKPPVGNRGNQPAIIEDEGPNLDGVNLPALFFEEGDDPIEVAPENNVQQVQIEEEEDIDMGGLFGDDDDYWKEMK